MLSKNRLKFIKSLQLKKFRKQENLFLIEGAKSVAEILKSDYKIHTLLVTDEFFNCYASLIESRVPDYISVTGGELEQAGTFESNNAALAVAHMKENRKLQVLENEYVLVLNDTRDPGNLGTIIRIADWYGIGKVLCSEETTDFYNPKVIASSMGSFLRVEHYYTDLVSFLKEYPDSPIYCTSLTGQSIYNTRFAKGGFIIMGNESHGVSVELQDISTDKITIPRFGQAESLNAGVATAIVLDNMKRSLMG